METIISASLLNSDMAKLGCEARRAEAGGAKMLHIDVMDGVFVPSITIGDCVQASLRKETNLTFDTHLMVTNPTGLIPLFVKGGSDIITIHIESNCNALETLRLIRRLNVKAGLSIKPVTPATAVFPYLNEVDMILVMTVEPGLGGQEFMEDMLVKVSDIREESLRRNIDIDIEVDGGINNSTAKLAKEAGANILVAGTYLFKHRDMKEAVDLIINT